MRRSASSSPTSAQLSRSVTSGRPTVSVPVLSNATVSMLRAASRAWALLIRIPRAAPRPVPTMIAVGVASPSAHGHAMMSTATKAVSAWVSTGAGPSRTQAAKARPAITNTIGTNTASRWMGAFEPWASSTNRTICASVLSPPTRVARTRSAPVVLSVPPVTSSPADRSTGIDSPVSIDSSTADAPARTRPSAAIVSPGRTSTMSPTFS